MITFTPFHSKFTPEMAGLLPSFFNPEDPRPAAEQLNENYQHGGGWHPQKGWELKSIVTWEMKYPGDPSITPIAWSELPLTKEILLLYPHSYLCIVQENKTSFEMGRVD